MPPPPCHLAQSLGTKAKARDRPGRINGEIGGIVLLILAPFAVK